MGALYVPLVLSKLCLFVQFEARDLKVELLLQLRIELEFANDVLDALEDSIQWVENVFDLV